MGAVHVLYFCLLSCIVVASHKHSLNSTRALAADESCFYIDFNPDCRTGNLMFQYATMLGLCALNKLDGKYCAIGETARTFMLINPH